MRISFNKKQDYSGKITKMQTQNTKIPRGELHLQDEHITQNITKKGPNVHNKQTKTPKRNKTESFAVGEDAIGTWIPLPQRIVHASVGKIARCKTVKQQADLSSVLGAWSNTRRHQVSRHETRRRLVAAEAD
ncbi:hypothetical protein CJ030_MR0G024315 [Morella rubra]|uniref:Uncharacterized protein n=1 Tax=Morella rubra TaxID=262757 RepID=A0A6A1UFQ8_9ROSI|nr:hypothetical protein CJ030_MR0G024315 [Morella rubra]